MSWFIDLLATLFLILMGISGFKRGLIEELGRLIGLISALIVSISLTPRLSQLLLKHAPMDNWIALSITYITLFSTVLIIGRLLTRFAHIAYLSKSNQWVNHYMGFAFGSMKGFFIIISFTWFIAILPIQKWSNIIASNSRISKFGTKFRTKVVSIFNWEDPVFIGESYIMELTQP